MVKSYWWWGGGPCDYCVTPVPTGLGFLFGTTLGLVLGLGQLVLGQGLDNDGDEDSDNDDGKDIHTFTPTYLQP